jgi:FlaA1/EpsC-like NDP-sugar epimerase
MRHRSLLFALDLCVVALASLCAQLLRDNFETRPDQVLALLPYLGLTLLVAAPVLTLFGLNRGIWRFSAMPDYLWAVAAAILIVTSAVVLGFLVNRLEGVARSLPIIQGVLIAAGLVGARVFARLRHAGRKRGPAVLKAVPEPAGQHESVLLVGVGHSSGTFWQPAAPRVGTGGQVRRRLLG